MFDLMKQLPDFLQPLAEKARDEQRKANEVRRAALAAERAALEKKCAKALPALLAAREAAEARVAAAQKALGDAQGEAWVALTAIGDSSNELQHGTNRMNAELRALADPRIDTFVEELEDMLPTLRRQAPEMTERLRGRTFTGVRIVDLLSTRPGILAKIEDVRNAIDRARALQTTGGVDVAREIEQIRASIRVKIPLTVVAEGVVPGDGGYRQRTMVGTNDRLPPFEDEQAATTDDSGFISPDVALRVRN